ncbi:alpha/beta fold hydrolase [Reyranella sp.]|uniref:alpha/beta fold hydrolase n=1 Tax=Reyranella sp. TaxID=1929291 RepID=UPI003784CB55
MLTRRNLLRSATASVPVAAAGIIHWPTASWAQIGSKTFVLAHGSWHGGWCWKKVADRLRAKGHTVYTPSYTGMGERAHLLSRDITINTFSEDLVQLIQSEELSNVILVGHSFGGVPISGAADRVPEKIAHLVYLDSVLVESGRSAFSYYPPAEAEGRIKAAEKATNGVAVPVPQQLPGVWGLGKEGNPDYDWVRRRLSPHPLQTYTTALTLKGPVGNNLPRTYIHSTQPSHPVLEDSRKLVRSWSGWRWVDLEAPHDSMITHPDAVVELLLGT